MFDDDDDDDLFREMRIEGLNTALMLFVILRHRENFRRQPARFHPDLRHIIIDFHVFFVFYSHLPRVQQYRIDQNRK